MSDESNLFQQITSYLAKENGRQINQQSIPHLYLDTQSLQSTMNEVLELPHESLGPIPEFFHLSMDELTEQELAETGTKYGRFTQAEFIALRQLLTEYRHYQRDIQGGEVFGNLFLKPWSNSISTFGIALARVAAVRENLLAANKIITNNKENEPIDYESAIEEDANILGAHTIAIIVNELNNNVIQRTDLNQEEQSIRQDFNQITANFYLECLQLAQELGARTDL